MQYTIRQIPKQLDKALRAKAKAEKKSLNQVAIDALKCGLGLCGETAPKRDLSFLVGSMDDETLRAIQQVREESERIWPEDWR